jgi:hypothetical protein
MTEENGKERNEDGTFGKGNKASANRGPNKVSSKVKMAIVQFLEENMDKVQADFDKLKPKDRLLFIVDILPYATPKLSSIQSEVEQEIKGGITIRWEDPNIQNRQPQGGS